MKRGKKLLLLLVALAVVSLTAWGISALTAPEEQASVENSGETVFTLDTESLNALSWCYGETELSFTKADSVWEKTEDPAYPLDESYITSALDALMEIKAEKVIETPNELSQYGLEEPACTVTAGDATLSFGDETAIDGLRYLSLEDGKVYLVDAAVMTPFTYSLLDMVTMEEIPDLSELTEIAITTEEESFTLVDMGENDLTYSDHYTWFIRDGDSYTKTDQDAAAEIKTYLESLTWSACAAYGAEDLSAYGLDVPAATYTVTYPDGTFTLHIGDSGDDGIYARLGDSAMVYTVDETTGSVLGAISRDALQCTDIIRLSLEEVESVEITLDGSAYTVAKATESETDEDGNVTEATVWKSGDEVLAIADTLEGLSELSGEATEEASTTQELSFIFHTQAQDITLVFYRLDGTSCLASLNGEAPLLISRSEVVSLKEAINTLVL